MRINSIACAAAVIAGSLVPSAVLAATVAVATADLNIRSGPGPEHPVIGAIPSRGQATITGCIQGSLWCQVAYGSRQGWAYSGYLTTQFSGRPVIVAERHEEIGIPVVTYETTGSADGAVFGAITAAPNAAATAISDFASAVTGFVPPPEVRTYVVGNPVQPVYLDREVVVGSTLPETVELRTVPDYRYRYVYVNRQPVLVEPGTRRIVYVYR
jgi:uncharacterized protein YraI